MRDLCINRNNHQKPTFHPLGDFLNPALALLGQGLKKSPIGQKLDFANHPYLCKGLNIFYTFAIYSHHLSIIGLAFSTTSSFVAPKIYVLFRIFPLK
ncbi:hypothetical protein BSPCLSOX_734 [uncultured Gammaproteobacteria bacterium]|nr:hypothetical protein BSPCLSOX_734 [uncultured Gammaproteobacteria bacterium]